jgi:acetylornithine deacetylase
MQRVLYSEAKQLLVDLIGTPSLSGNEAKAANIIQKYLERFCLSVERKYNNVWAVNRFAVPGKKTLLLNSHLDTVKPNIGWKIDPYKPKEYQGKLYGLGSNDAGGALVALFAVFKYFYDRPDLPYNLMYTATAEEETTGANGISAILRSIGVIDLAIVGEPTGMDLAVAEKGLIVLECEAKGVAGHAARDLGENAILKAIPDIQWFSSYKFDRISKYLGPVKMTVTQINAGYQHNVIPDSCTFTVDIRTTDVYTHEEIMDVINKNISSEVKRGSLRLNPSGIPDEHTLVKAAKKLGISTFGSPTLSDQALLNVPSVKMGPGRSERSHTADEYIELNELEEGITKYIQLLEAFFKEESK